MRSIIAALLLLALMTTAAAQSLPPAIIINDEGGPVAVSGTMAYTNPLLAQGIAQPLVILEDQAGFVDRNLGFLMPRASQTLGQLTSDFYTSPVTYSLTLPIEPQGSYRDVDNDGSADTGVQIYAVAFWNNVWGDPYLEERDLYGGGWSTAYASTNVSSSRDTLYEIIGGKLVVYAQDADQGFPSGFGDDGRLFTADDPIVSLPQGWTVIDLDTDPFTFDRSRNPVIDLIEPAEAALDDFSAMSYTNAFDAMLRLMKQEYAFTELKGVDWSALSAEFRPRFVEADARNDRALYEVALMEFLWQIPDGHIGVYPLSDAQIDELIARINGGLGMVVRETDDGSAFVTFITPNAAADNAGIELGAQIVEFNGMPVADAISQVLPITSPFSTDHVRRLNQAALLTRLPVGTAVDVTYINPGASRPQTVTLNADFEFESYDAALAAEGTQPTGYELPVEYELLDSGYVLARIWSFQDNDLLTIQLWERLMQTLNDQGAAGLIIDMRNNGGGSGFLADQMAAYFFDEPLLLGGTANYDRSVGTFVLDEERPDRFYLPPENLRYRGRIAVLVGPSCFSACEFFVHNMTLQNRAAIVGHYPTGGLGGSVTDFAMPNDLFVRFTTGRALDAEGNIHIEGRGIAPTVRVPVTAESLLSEEDEVLQAAVDYLSGN